MAAQRTIKIKVKSYIIDELGGIIYVLKINRENLNIKKIKVKSRNNICS